MLPFGFTKWINPAPQKQCAKTLTQSEISQCVKRDLGFHFGIHSVQCEQGKNQGCCYSWTPLSGNFRLASSCR
jgi:hypothetical protein